jgi:hypothetical protein
MERLQQVRMQVRRVMDAHGNHRLSGGMEWDVVWLNLVDLGAYFQRDVDQNQIRRLCPADRDAFLDQASGAMERLGYDITETTSDDVAEPECLPLRGASPPAPRPSDRGRVARAA